MSFVHTIKDIQVDCIKDNKILNNNTLKIVRLIKTYKLFSKIWTKSKSNVIFKRRIINLKIIWNNKIN